MMWEKVWLKAYLASVRHSSPNESQYFVAAHAEEIADKCLKAFKARFSGAETPEKLVKQPVTDEPSVLFMDKENVPEDVRFVLEKCGFNIKRTISDTDDYYELVREDVIFFSCDYQFKDIHQLYGKILQRMDSLIGDYS